MAGEGVGQGVAPPHSLAVEVVRVLAPWQCSRTQHAWGLAARDGAMGVERLSYTWSWSNGPGGGGEREGTPQGSAPPPAPALQGQQCPSPPRSLPLPRVPGKLVLELAPLPAEALEKSGAGMFWVVKGPWLGEQQARLEAAGRGGAGLPGRKHQGTAGEGLGPEPAAGEIHRASNLPCTRSRFGVMPLQAARRLAPLSGAAARGGCREGTGQTRAPPIYETLSAAHGQGQDGNSPFEAPRIQYIHTPSCSVQEGPAHETLAGGH